MENKIKQNKKAKHQEKARKVITKLMIYRKINDISQEKLAQMLGVSERTIGTWEREDNFPSRAKVAFLDTWIDQQTKR